MSWMLGGDWLSIAFELISGWMIHIPKGKKSKNKKLILGENLEFDEEVKFWDAL